MKIKTLLPILVLPFLTGCHIHVANNYNYDNADKYTKYTSELSVADKVENIEINYISGSIRIAKGEEFKLIEEQNEFPCYYWNNTENKKFTVQFVENGLDLDNKDFSKKNLDIIVPYDLKSLKLNLVSCGYSITAFNIDNLEVNVVSGSGVVNIDGNNRTDFDSISGSIHLRVLSTLNEEKININTVSGNSTLGLDQRRGFDVSFKKMSGTLTNDFGEPTDPTLAKYSIDINTVSGNTIINKNE